LGISRPQIIATVTVRFSGGSSGIALVAVAIYLFAICDEFDIHITLIPGVIPFPLLGAGPDSPPRVESSNSNWPPGYWPGDKGAAEWGRQNGIGAREGKNRFHGIKQSTPGSRGDDDYGVNPETGDVVDQDGEVVGNLEDED